MLVKIIKKIILYLCIALLVLSVDKAVCNIKKSADTGKYDTEIREYILNRRSKKIHINNCASVAKMSERNKQQVKNSLVNIMNDGYIICNNCYAGRKINKAIVDKIIDNMFGVDEKEIEKTLSDYTKYLEAINIMGEWYINHIPTYQNSLQEMKLSEYIGECDYINDVELKSIKHKLIITNNSYKYMTSDNSKVSRQEFDGATNILKAKETAIDNYKNNFEKIRFKSLAYYPCEYLSGSKDDYKMAGDDCVRFFFSCMNVMNNNFTSCLRKCTGKNWSHIDSKALAINNDCIAYSMKELGFDIYDMFQENIDINGDGKKEGKIFLLDSQFELKKGDILATRGHIHIYLDDGYGIGMKNFGWGKVNYLFPQLSKCSLEYVENEGYKIICNGMPFTRVYRYIGNGEEE